MDTLLRLIQKTLLKKSVICLLFAGALNVSAWAQGIFSPIITPPLVLPSVLSSGGAVTNGGILVITATVTSTTTVKGMTWYCGNQIVSPAKSTTVNTPVLNALGISIGTLSTLTVTGVASTNAGSYYLHATNSAGTTISSPAIVVVANLVNVITSTVTNVVSFVSDATGMVSTGFQIRLSGLTGSNVVIQASSDLSTWTPISTNTFVSGLVNFIDTSAKNRSFRYYRTLAQ